MLTPSSANVILLHYMEHCIKRMSVLYTVIQILCSDIIILAVQLLFSYIPFLHVRMLLYILLFYPCTQLCVCVCVCVSHIKSNPSSKWYSGVNSMHYCADWLKDVHQMFACIKCLTVSLAYYTDLNYNGMDITCYCTQSLTVCGDIWILYKVD